MDRSDVNVLLVRGDGRCVRWFSLPRWLVRAGITVTVLGALANTAALVHYVTVSRERASLAADNDVLSRSADALPAMRQRLREVREEIRTWDGLHADVLKPLGGAPRAAVGGPALAAAPNGTALDDLDILFAFVREETRRLRALAQITRETGGILAALPSRLPLRAALTSPFGPRVSPWTGEAEFHAGVDLAAPVGTPVKATVPGTVRFTGAMEGYGQTVRLDHGAGIESRYGHLQKIAVTAGQRVERGHVIGLTGNTGRSTGPHLHYEVLVNGRAVDPRRLARE